MPLTHRSRPPPCRLSPYLSPHPTPPCMTSLATRQKATKFNQPLNIDTSSVTSMEAMFLVRVLAPTSSRAASLRAASSTTAPTALSPPRPPLTLLRMSSLATRGRARRSSTSR
eukprot:scaffold10360_cov81-Phaeocystis_antarctica.AAC.2